MTLQDFAHIASPTGIELRITPAALSLVRKKGAPITIWLYRRPIGAG